MIKVKLQLSHCISPIIKYTWKLFAKHFEFDTEFVHEGQDVLIGTDETCDIQVSQKFIRNITQKKYAFRHYFENEPLIIENGKPDYLGTCFYLVNCLQEYNSQHIDKYGRFTFRGSLQEHYECINQNLVAGYFSELYKSLRTLNSKVKKRQIYSRLFLSHDIDSVYQAWLQDGFWALKNGRIDIVVKLLFNQFIGKPDWLDMNKIMNLEDEYDVKSVFFWLVKQGNYNTIKHSDYDIKDKRVQKEISHVKLNGFENGLHKSAFPDSYKQEISRVGFVPTGNRNHYLKIKLPGSFNKINDSSLMLDASLGFAEETGFRNSYGLPFTPFNIEKKSTFGFVEVALNIMDSTFSHYKKSSKKETLNQILDFLECNKRDAIISILWHNRFTPYKVKDYLEIYKAILRWARENGITGISMKEIIANWHINTDS